MRTFVLTIDGVARIMRTYGLAADRKVVTPDMDAEEVTPAPDAATEVAKWHPDKPRPTSIREITEGDIPTEWKYKDAWKDTGREIITDMPAARAIAQENIRQVREGLWQKHDAAVTRALVAEDSIAAREAEAKRQMLRDAPADPRLSRLPQTPDELKAAEDEIIKQISEL